MDSKINDLRKKYEAEANAMSTKSRFGFFSIMPSHTAGKTDYNKKQCRKSSDGRVWVENRNIFSGTTSSGVLKKSFFSVPKSIYQGDPYIKENQNSKNGEDSKQNNQNFNQTYNEQRQIFVPAKLNKTLATPAYKYICQNPVQKNSKCNRNQDGSVKTKLRNICVNSAAKITQQKMKTFKYTGCDYDNQKKIINDELKKSMSKRKEQPFRAGNSGKQYFKSNIEAFNDHQIVKRVKKVGRCSAKVEHEGAFRPSSGFTNKLFSYIRTQVNPKSNETQNQNHKSLIINKKLKPSSSQQKLRKQQPFKLSIQTPTTKPSPSISYSRINLLRSIR